MSLDLVRNLVNSLNRDQPQTDPLEISETVEGEYKVLFNIVHIEGLSNNPENIIYSTSDLSFSCSVPEERLDNSIFYKGEVIPVESTR